MEYVFGSTFVCKNTDAAKEVITIFAAEITRSNMFTFRSNHLIDFHNAGSSMHSTTDHG